MMRALRFHIVCLCLLGAGVLFAQQRDTVLFVGAVQHESLFPLTDISSDRVVERPSWAKIDHLSNTYVDLGLRYLRQPKRSGGLESLSAATRLEMLQWPLLGYEKAAAGYGVAHLHLDAQFAWGQITLGDVYGQFGSGLILRLYEERSLGIDNALRGAKFVLTPYSGIRFEALGGKMRRYWSCYDDGAWGFNYGRDAVVGANLELAVDQWSPRLQEQAAFLTLGASYVSKYQRYDGDMLTTIRQDGVPQLVRWNMPEWVGAGDVRASFQMKGWSALLEYAYKANDPCLVNIQTTPDGRFHNYRPGQALLASLSYSRKGMSFLAQAKRTDNMFFLSDRTLQGTASGQINHMPAFSTQHTFALAALYPYATQLAGEWAMQAEFRYTWKRGTRMGGKYGTSLQANFSHIRGLGERGWFSSGETYYTDAHVSLHKPLTKAWTLDALLMYQTYNQAVIETHPGAPTIRSGIGVLDVKWNTSSKVKMHAELQYLYTPHSDGQWIYGLYELTLFRQLTFSLSEQYCIGSCHITDDPQHHCEVGEHYYSALVSWRKKAHNLRFGYNKTRAGFNCSGGVCRYIPQQNGLTLSYNYVW